MIIATEKNYYKKENDLILIEVEILKPILIDNTWECSLNMRGYGDVNRKLFGQTSIQALTFAMQHAKFNLKLMIDDGYNYFEKEENKLSSKEETLEILHSVYGQGTLLDEAHKKAIYLQCIKRLQKGNGNENEQNTDINYLQKEFLDPKIIDYIYYTEPKLTNLEIYEKAMSYIPIKM
jgi:hypothetical protein